MADATIDALRDGVSPRQRARPKAPHAAITAARRSSSSLSVAFASDLNDCADFRTVFSVSQGGFVQASAAEGIRLDGIARRFIHPNASLHELAQTAADAPAFDAALVRLCLGDG